jgi:hypothetical protein
MLSTRKPYDPLKHQKNLFKWALLAASLFIGILILNYFRKPLLGYEPKHLNDNIAFNIFLFIPVILTSVLISYFVTGHTLIGWRKMKDRRLKFLCLVLTLPILLLTACQVLLVLSNH